MSENTGELSRIEKLVKAILGEDVELEPSQSRLETLLYAVLAKVRANSMDFTAEEIAALASQGIASAVLNVGDLVYVSRTRRGITKEYAWEIADIGETTVTLRTYRVFTERTLGTEAIYYAENGLEPGWYSITPPDTDSSIIVSGFSPWYFELKHAVPAGGCLVVDLARDQGTTTGGSSHSSREISEGHVVYYDPNGNEIDEAEIPWVSEQDGDIEVLPEGYTEEVVGNTLIEHFDWCDETASHMVYYDPNGDEVAEADVPWVDNDGVEELPEGYTEERVYAECTDLGLADGTVTNLNHISRALAGSCEWPTCYLRAWLNSDQPAGSWSWTHNGTFDIVPEAEDGFLYGWEEGFLNSIKATDHDTIDINSVTWLPSLQMDVDTITTTDRVFLPSLEEAGGGLPDGLEGIEGTALASSVLFPPVRLTADSGQDGKARAVQTRTPNVYTHAPLAIGVDDRAPSAVKAVYGICPCVIIGGDDQ